jgi:hypothetical protein
MPTKSPMTQRAVDLVKRLVENQDMSVARELISYGVPVISHIVAKVGDVWSPEAREAGLGVIGRIEGPATAVLLDWCTSPDDYARCAAIMAMDDRLSAGKADCMPYLAQIRATMQVLAQRDTFSRAREEAKSVLRELDRHGW